MDSQYAQAFANEWIKAWNERDAEGILAHYSEDVEFQSSLARRLMGDVSGTVRGKQQLREYFGKALTAFPGSLAIKLLGVYEGIGSLVIHFQACGRNAIEVMELDHAGKIRRAITLSQV